MPGASSVERWVTSLGPAPTTLVASTPEVGRPLSLGVVINK